MKVLLLQDAGVHEKNKHLRECITLQKGFRNIGSHCDIWGRDHSHCDINILPDFDSYDLIIDESVDDIKSASDWSYRNKFESFDTLSADDAFGYVGQLAGYAKALGKKAGGWWVVNKANGSFKYVPAENIDVDKEVKKLEENVKTVKSNVFKRCYESEEETFRGKPTGNRVLSKTCSFCRYKHSCWENLQELPSLLSKAKEPKIVSYVSIRKEQVA